VTLSAVNGGVPAIDGAAARPLPAVLDDAIAGARILVVDDQPVNLLLLQRVLDQWGYRNVHTTTDPATVLELCLKDPPDLVMLDLQMPGLDGFDVLELLRPLVHATPAMPVIVVTADVTRETCERALLAGARDFLTKPFDHREVGLRTRSALETRAAHVELKHQNETLETEVVSRTWELEQTKLDVIDRLAMASEFRDDETQEHAQRVGRTASLIGRALGVSEKSIATLRCAATLHDIGKIGVPDSILLKPGKLTPAEYDVMRGHARIGFEILDGSRSELLRVSAMIALTHHERWDGTGYPEGLAGGQIPISGRLVAVADVFDALTHERPYKLAWSIEDAVAEIRNVSGTQFDPRVVDAFCTLDHPALLAPVAASPLARGPLPA
jgi:response regulator RpfG family c-di-GMP phosphodiesterase